MNPDLYTKAVLTVIAASLLWICVDRTIHPSSVAAQGIQRVILTGIDATVDSSNGTIPVRIIGGTAYPTLPVGKDNPLAVLTVEK